MHRLSLSLLLVLSVSASSFAKDVEEKYPNGQVKVKYSVDKANQKEGPYFAYFPNGKKRVAASYKDGSLTGFYTEFTEGGLPRVTANYEAGRLKGVLKLLANAQPIFTHDFKEDEPGLPRPLAEMQNTLAEIDTVPSKKVDAETAERQAALRRLQSYRYLAGVPYQNLVLDDEMNACCDAGAKLLEKLGKLEHTPMNPGLPEDEFKIAYKGTSKSNIAQGFNNLTKSVDAWMDDSDPGNIQHLGHRRWCLNPLLMKTGFGRKGIFSCMYSLDMSQPKAPETAYYRYPAAGWMPLSHFGKRHAWNVILNPKVFKKPSQDISIKVSLIPNGKANASPESVPLNFKKIDAGSFGGAPCLIFRPETTVLADGSRYLVEIEGLERTSGKKETLRYLVFFVKT